MNLLRSSDSLFSNNVLVEVCADQLLLQRSELLSESISLPRLSLRVDSPAMPESEFESGYSSFPAASVVSLALNVFAITGGLGLLAGGLAESAIAQSPPNLNYEPNTGVVEVDNNAFDIRTGSFENGSNIPLPTILPRERIEAVSQPLSPTRLAPNSIEISPDVNYVNSSFNELLNAEAQGVSYELQPESLRLNTQFGLERFRGSHDYGEGIEATVTGPDGQVISNESAFIRGDKVQRGADGVALPDSGQLTVEYGANDTVRLRVLNIRSNGAQPTDSAIYFGEDGQFVVEDMLNGGDGDFNDGEYVQITGGQGEAVVVRSRDDVRIETLSVDTPLSPEQRQEEFVESDMVTTVESAGTVSEEVRSWGSVETPDSAPLGDILGHATRAQTADGRQLIYSRYSAASEARLGSDGLGVRGQLPPLSSNPNAAPTLLTGSATLNPFVGDNEAGFTTTVGITQFLNPTHRVATDVFGNVMASLDPTQGPLVEPIGLFSNRRWVGYVPPTPDETVLSDAILPVNGIFELPSDKAVTVAPSDAQAVGRGNAAYLRNVGGLLVEAADGSMSFVPQWTAEGYAQEPLVLEAGEAQRVIYALVPQQAGQSLVLNERYAVTSDASGYRIADGGYRIISADKQPQNFVQETSDVYAVEDTLPGTNASTPLFNGIPGIYIEIAGSAPVPTVDVTVRSEADARVGNGLFPMETVLGDPGQRGYAQTTLAAGFYLGSSLTTGIGNQRDEVTRITTSLDRQTDEMRTRRTLTTFATPLLQRDTVVLQNTETTRSSNNAFFNINSQGLLTDLRLVENGPGQTSVNSAEVSRDRVVIRGEEVNLGSVTSETREPVRTEVIARDQETTTGSDSYANISALQSELTFGGVLNFGNTPWTAAANTFRAELFTRDTVLGRSSGSETGYRAEVIFHPFGEEQREAFHYDAAGNVVPLYKTEPVIDAGGIPVVESLLQLSGLSAQVPIHQYALDESGDRIAQTVGTGKSRGPGVYVRLEDVLSDSESALVAGGIQFAF
jgi:hypothetical protein